MCRQNHGVSVDYFAAGVMAFECMFGRVSNIIVVDIFIETIRWKDKIRNQGSHFI